MPEPLEQVQPRALWGGATWPVNLPKPQAGSLQMKMPPRADSTDVMSGPTRIYLAARTAPPEWNFSVWLSRAQMETFETWVRDLVNNSDGEFYAPWIGQSRILAFAAPYTYRALGSGWEVSCRVVRTRIDPSVCDAIINAAFGNILRDDGASANNYLDDGATTNIVADDFSLTLIAQNGC